MLIFYSPIYFAIRQGKPGLGAITVPPRPQASPMIHMPPDILLSICEGRFLLASFASKLFIRQTLFTRYVLHAAFDVALLIGWRRHIHAASCAASRLTIVDAARDDCSCWHQPRIQPSLRLPSQHSFISYLAPEMTHFDFLESKNKIFLYFYRPGAHGHFAAIFAMLLFDFILASFSLADHAVSSFA